MDIFKLVGSIFINNQDANAEIDNTTNKAKSLSESIGSAMKQTGEKISGLGTKLLPVSLAIAGVGAVAVKSSAEVKAMNSQFEQTFGSLQNEASDAMNRVATESGILQTRLRGVGTSIYAFAKSSGADSAEAMSLMETALRATADASAYYDRSLEETSESLMSFLKGNFANDAQLGVSCTETTRNAKAMELFGQKYNDLTEIQKQQTLLKMVTDAQALSGAMGQASRESDGFENVMGNLKESAKQAGAELGAVLLPTVIKLIQGLTGLIQKFTSMDDRTKKLIVTVAGIVAGLAPVLIVFGKMTSAVGTAITVFGKMPSVITSVSSKFALLKGTLLGVPPATTMTANGMVTVAGKTGLLSKALTALTSPVGIVIGVLAVLAGAFVTLWKNNEEFRNKVTAIWNEIKDTFNKFTQGIVDRLNSLGFNFESITDVIKGIWELFCNFLAPIFEGAFQYIANTIETVTNVILGILDFFISVFKGDWEGAWNAVSGIFESIWNGIVAYFENIGNTLVGILDVICGWFGTTWSETWTAIETFFVNIWNGIVTFFVNVWNGIKNTVQVAIMFIAELFTLAFDLITLPFRFIWENCKDTIMQIWDTISTWLSEKLTAISDFFTSVWTAISDFFKGVWDAISSYVSEKITAIKEKVSAVMETIRNVFTNIWNAIKDKVSSIMDAVKEKVSAVWDSVKEKVSSVIDGIKSSIESKLNSAKEIVGGILDSIKEKFSSIFDGAKEIVSDAIEFIKGKFNFSWSLPKLKLPHFSISGGFSLNPPSVPKFGIEWYKHGGVMLDPTIFGFNGNKAMVGGEAGDEAIAPIDILLNYIRTAVAEQNASLIQSLKDAIDDLGSKISNQTNGDIIIPVYIGETMIDDIIVNARKNVTLRSGGLTSV